MFKGENFAWTFKIKYAASFCMHSDTYKPICFKLYIMLDDCSLLFYVSLNNSWLEANEMSRS